VKNQIPGFRLLFIVFISGCAQSPGQPPLTVAMNNVSQKESTAHEWFIFVAAGLPSSVMSPVGKELQTLIGTTARTGDVVHVVLTPTHQPISTITVPHGTRRTRLRKPAVLNEFRRLAEVFRSETDGADTQLQVPVIPATVRALRATDSPVRVILVGDPLYDDPLQQGWSMIGGYVPTDTSIKDPRSPFRTVHSLEDTEISWLTPSSNWGADHGHREAVIRFYRLFFQEHGAQLLRFTVDSQAAFNARGGTQFSEPLVADASEASGMKYVALVTARGDNEAGKEHEIEVIVPELQPLENAPEQVQEVIREAEKSSDEILLAINWASADPHSDLDLWIRSKGADEEMNFTRMQTSFGELIRDVRHAGSVAGDGADFQKWEMARITHNRLTDITLWLNAFNTNSPVSVRLITVWNGRRGDHVFEWNVSQGDMGHNASQRGASNAWRQIALSIEP